MTAFDIVVPVAALVIAAAAVLWTRHEGRKLDRRMRDDPPAE